MFETTSLSFRAVIASLLGSCFGVALILATHGAQAQTLEPTADVARSTTLGSLRTSSVTSVAYGRPAARGLRVPDSGSERGATLRWQLAPTRALRDENENPGSSRGDTLGLGVQLRF